MGAIRVISVEQGEDPREFTLVAFGGAGPLHAADIARAMGIRHVLIPPQPGLLSAIGLLHADVRGDFSLTRLVHAQPDSLRALSPKYPSIRLPVFIVAQADSALRRTAAERLHGDIAGSTLDLLPGTGHFVHLEKTAEVVRTIHRAAGT